MEYKVEGHESSYVPVEGYELTWADEFDGKELDTSKWMFRNSMMGKKWISWTDSEKALYLDGNSNAIFELIEDEEDGHLCCAQLQTGSNPFDAPVIAEEAAADQGDGVEILSDGTISRTIKKDDMHWCLGKLREQKALFKYGYFECRCKLQQQPGWWSAFWMQSPTIGTTLDAKISGSEVDIMESFIPNTMNWNNVFSAGYGCDERRTKLGPFRRDIDASKWHRFGLLWEEDKYTFYVDGEKTYETDVDVSAVPEFLLISTEVFGYRKPEHAPVDKAFGSVGDKFMVDYVRVFQKKG